MTSWNPETGTRTGTRIRTRTRTRQLNLSDFPLGPNWIPRSKLDFEIQIGFPIKNKNACWNPNDVQTKNAFWDFHHIGFKINFGFFSKKTNRRVPPLLNTLPPERAESRTQSPGPGFPSKNPSIFRPFSIFDLAWVNFWPNICFLRIYRFGHFFETSLEFLIQSL